MLSKTNVAPALMELTVLWEGELVIEYYKTQHKGEVVVL